MPVCSAFSGKWRGKQNYRSSDFIYLTQDVWVLEATLLLLLDMHREAQHRSMECLEGGDQGRLKKLPHIYRQNTANSSGRESI